MPDLSFGQPDDGVMQMAYTVPDIRAAIDHWVTKLNVGPWFLLEHFSGEHAVYRGAPSTADVAIAMAFAGHMNIELIPVNPLMEQAFGAFQRASVGWDGTRPIRPFV